jgi:dTDP-4-amino-4,6-dideoxy-D-galactose acyltransferase
MAGLRLVYLKAPQLDELAVRRRIGGTPIRGLHTDERVVFELELTDSNRFVPPGAPLLRSYPVGLPSPDLVSLALQAGEHSRFRTDPIFPEAAFLRLYSEWIRRSTLREVCSEVLVADAPSSVASNILGFVTVTCSNDTSSVGLIAVRPDARGGGLGKALLAGAIDAAQRTRCSRIRITTQQSNEAACALYRKLGFSPIARSFVHHLWFA